MHFVKVLTLGLVSGASARAIVARQVSPLINAISEISKGVAVLDTGIDGLTATSDVAKAAADLTTKSEALIAIITAQTKIVAAAPALNLVDAANLVAPATKLSDQVKVVINKFIAKRDIIVKGGQVPLVNAQLKKQAVAAKGLIDVIVTKVPANLATVAQNIAGAITESINKGITIFTK